MNQKQLKTKHNDGIRWHPPDHILHELTSFEHVEHIEVQAHELPFCICS